MLCPCDDRLQQPNPHQRMKDTSLERTSRARWEERGVRASPTPDPLSWVEHARRRSILELYALVPLRDPPVESSIVFWTGHRCNAARAALIDKGDTQNDKKTEGHACRSAVRCQTKLSFAHSFTKVQISKSLAQGGVSRLQPQTNTVPFAGSCMRDSQRHFPYALSHPCASLAALGELYLSKCWLTICLVLILLRLRPCPPSLLLRLHLRFSLQGPLCTISWRSRGVAPVVFARAR